MTPIFPESPQDWTNAKPGKVYYNSKTDKFTTTILTDKEVISDAKAKEESRRYYESFVINILRNLNKREDRAAELESLVELSGKYIDPSPLIKEKMLLSISKKAFTDIEEKDDVSIVGLTTVVYDLGTFFQKLENIAKKFQEYQSQYISNVFSHSTNVFNGVDFLLESENLYTLGSNIKSLIESNSLNLFDFKKIQISRNEDTFVSKICLIQGIDSVNVKYLFEEFKNGYPQNSPQTLIFLFDLVELEKRIKNSSNNYETIATQYFLNSSKKRDKTTDLISRSAKKGSTSASPNEDISKQFASSKEISKRSVKLLQKEILDSVYRTPCMTPEQRERINRQLERETKKKANFARRMSLSVSDTFFENLPEVLQKVAMDQGEEALNSLGKNLLNRLGLCGIGDLTSLVTNTVFAYINEEEYVEELAKCAVRNLDNKNVSQLWGEVGKFGKNSEILERYRKFVGDTIPPWTAGGYMPPDYTNDTDDTIIATYSLKLKTSQQDTDIDLRFSAFRDSIAASIRGEELLDVLVNSFPDEMGWLRFFTDMTKGILNKCKVPMPNATVSMDLNWCQGRVNLPKFPEVPKREGGFIPKPSDIGNVLVEELKNILINLTVRVIIESMRQIFQIIAAGMSFDEEYFKKNQYVPDLFQDDESLQKQIAEYCKDTSSNFRQVNSSVRQIFQQKYPSTYAVEPLSLEDVDRFLKSCSVGLGHYDKVRLYNGDGESVTYEKVLGLIKDLKVSQYMLNYSDVDQIFLEIGNLLDADKVEEQFYQSLSPEQLVEVDYCGNDFDSLEQAYLNNKPSITQDQISEMKEVLKNIQKDKICFAAETLGNPNGVIVGQLGEILKSKQGPLFSKISKHIGNLFQPVIENKIDTACKNYKNDLYNSRGLLDLIMVNTDGIGENRRLISSFFGKETKPESPQSMQNSRIIDATYSPSKTSSNITLTFEGAKTTSYRDKSPESAAYETGADKIQTLLLKNQSILRNNLNNKISENFINNGVLTSIVESYFSDMLTKLEKRTYGGSWRTKVYNRIRNREEEFIPLLFGKDAIIKETKDLYGLMDDVEKTNKYVPFNRLKSKEDIALSYASFRMLINTVTSEVLIKNLPIYEAFGANMLHQFDYLGDYIYEKFVATVDDFSTNRGQAKVLEKIVQVAIVASNEGLISPLDSHLESNVSNLNNNIKNWLQGDRESRMENLEKNTQDIEALARFFVKENSKKYITEFQEAMADIENNTFPSINKTNTIYNYIFNESILGSTVNVISDPDKVGVLTGGLRLEKYIILNGAKPGLPSGVQNLKKFQEYLVADPLSGNISENWESWSFGLRISSLYDFSKAGVLEMDISLDLRNQAKAFTLISDSEAEEKERYFLSPLVVYEKEIPDQPISSRILDDYDEISMKKGLSQINDFSNFYYRGMNIENLISLATIYCNEEFGTFLENGASNPLLPTTVDNWNGKVLNDTKKFIVNTLERI